MKKVFKKTFLITFGLLLLAFISWSFFIEPQMLIVKKEKLKLTNWQEEHAGLKVAIMSDFHLGFFHVNRKKLNKIIEASNSQNPDIVFLLGDYINKYDKNRHYLSFLSDLKKIKASIGVFAVLGNHEEWYHKSDIIKTLNSAGIKVLINNSTKVKINNKHFWIAGIDDYMGGNPDIKKALSNVGKNSALFLSHNPKAIYNTPKSISLVIAAHTHGGQIYFPAFIRNILPDRIKSKLAYPTGYSEIDGKKLFITSGIGTTIFPARFLVPPEIVILELY